MSPRHWLVLVLHTPVARKRLGLIAPLLACMAASPPAIAATSTAEKPAAVTYHTPSSWSLEQTMHSPTGADLEVYSVSKNGKEPVLAIVMIKSLALKPGDQRSNAVFNALAKQAVPSGALVAEVNDGPAWRTYLFTGPNPFGIGHSKHAATLYRVGIDGGYAVEEIFQFPLDGSASEGPALLTIAGQAQQPGQTTGIYSPRVSTGSMVDAFNRFTRTISINGKNQFDAQAVVVVPADKPTAVYRQTGQP